MLINDFLLIAITILFAAVVAVLLFWLLKKRMNPKKSGLFSIIAGILFFVLFSQNFGKVYIIHANHQVEFYRTVGTFDMELANGSKIQASVPVGHVGVVNNTTDKLVVEEVLYGGKDSIHSKNYYIDSFLFQHMELPDSKINYWFDDLIPDKIRIPLGGEKSKYWLHEIEKNNP